MKNDASSGWRNAPADDEDLLLARRQPLAACQPHEEAPDPIGQLAAEQQQRPLLQRTGDPLGKLRALAQQRVQPLERVLVVDCVLRHRRGFAEQLEDDRLGTWAARIALLRVGRLVGRKRKLLGQRLAVVANVIDRAREQAVEGGADVQVQRGDSCDLQQRVGRLRADLGQQVVDDAVQPLLLVTPAKREEGAHRGVEPAAALPVDFELVARGEPFADQPLERQAAAGAVVHQHELGAHDRDKLAAEDVADEVVPEVFVRLHLLAAGAGGW